MGDGILNYNLPFIPLVTVSMVRIFNRSSVKRSALFHSSFHYLLNVLLDELAPLSYLKLLFSMKRLFLLLLPFLPSHTFQCVCVRMYDFASA